LSNSSAVAAQFTEDTLLQDTTAPRSYIGSAPEHWTAWQPDITVVHGYSAAHVSLSAAGQ
jgi:hypothetical protein